MTEAVFLPAFVLATFAVAYMLERPTLLAQVGAFAAIALAVSIRVQGIVLLLVIPTAVLLKVAFDWRAGVPRSELVAWLPAPLAVRCAARRRRRALRLLQARRERSAARERSGPVQLARRGSLPARPDRALDGQAPGGARSRGRARAYERADRAALARRCGGAPTTAAERAFLAVVPAALLWVLVETGAFAATTTPALFERYTFYLEPLLLLAFVVWLTRGLPRPRVGTAVALGVPALLLLSLTLAQVVSPDAVNGVTLSALYRFSVHLPGGIHELKASIAAAAVLAAFLFAICARPIARIALPLLLGVYFGVAGTSIIDNTRNVEGRAIAGSDPSWVEHAVGRDEPVVYVNTPELGSDASVLLLQTEFWNPNVSHVYSVGASDICQLPETPTTLDTAHWADRTAGSGRRSLRARRPERPVCRDTRGSGRIGRRSAGPLPHRPLATRQARRPKVSTATVGWEHTLSTPCSSRPVGGPGRMVVTLGRAGWGGTDVPGRVRISLGRPAASGTRACQGVRGASLDRSPARAANIRLRGAPASAAPGRRGGADVRSFAVRPRGHPPARGSGLLFVRSEWLERSEAFGVLAHEAQRCCASARASAA